MRNVIIWHSLVAGAAISSQQAKGLAHRAPQCPPPPPPTKTFLRLCLEPHICIGSHPLPSTDLMGFSPISFVPFILFYYFFIKQQVLSQCVEPLKLISAEISRKHSNLKRVLGGLLQFHHYWLQVETKGWYLEVRIFHTPLHCQVLILIIDAFGSCFNGVKI